MTIPDGPQARDVKVAVILDVFSTDAFRYEWQQITFGPEDWREVLERERPAMLFVESAWHGNGGRWATMMSAAGAPKQPVRDLVAWCREQGVPTVFWNKEDPPNFDRFIETAKLFDQVFTVDADCIPRYVEAVGHDRVALAAVRAHSRASTTRSRCRAGAGTRWRSPGLTTPRSIPSARRRWRRSWARRGSSTCTSTAASPTTRTSPSLRSTPTSSSARSPYERMLAAYKAYKIFLNVNSVTESPTMCARRVFELSACGTPVVSGHSRALERVFGDLVRLSSAPEQTTEALVELMKDAELRDRTGHLAMREVFARAPVRPPGRRGAGGRGRARRTRASGRSR